MTPTMRGKQKDTSKQSTPQSIKNAIQIMCEDQMLSVCANTFEEREKWIEALEDITQSFHSKRGKMSFFHVFNSQCLEYLWKRF